jgi:hypothetical protein
VAAKREMFRYGSKASRLLILAVQSMALVAGWAIWAPAALGQLRLALVYVLAVWILAGGITLWMYVAFSMAPFSDLLAASLRASESAMWLVPGALLLAGPFAGSGGVGAGGGGQQHATAGVEPRAERGNNCGEAA